MKRLSTVGASEQIALVLGLSVLLLACSSGGDDQLVDACATDNGGCGDPTYTTCTNNPGAPPTCDDIDECQTYNGGCGDPSYVACNNNLGAPPTCADIDECQQDNGGCGAPSHYRCTNIDGAPPQCSLAYVPPPDPADTGDYLIGAFYMPAWNMKYHWAWPSIEDFPDRKPLLGYYDEGNPEAMDWEIKWAQEHGVSFFIFDWFRIRCPGPCADEPQPITVDSLSLGHALHEGFFESRYGDGDDETDMKFAIMLTSHHPWNRILYSAEDAEKTLIPFLVENYFKRANYLKIDGKPVLYHYNSNAETVAELESDTEIIATLAAMRRAVVSAGFPGLILLAENRNPDSVYSYQRAKDLGFDYLHNYVWGATAYGTAPTDAEGISYQMDAMRSRLEADVIPFVPGATMGWDSTPLGPSATRWKLRPPSYNQLLRQIKLMMDDELDDPLSKRMLVVGAWNELSEGHYITPHQAYGFAYLEEIRAVFSDAKNTPDYRLPQELGLGPYDSMYQDYIRPRDPDLVAHYELDGDGKDASTMGFDGTLHGAPAVVQGARGQAFDFDGVDDYISVPDDYRLEGIAGVSFSAWINVEEFVNGGVAFEKDGGYRLVVSTGGAGHCVVGTKYTKMYAPETVASFSAGAVSLGNWHHLLCVYDGEKVSAFVDGQLVGFSSGTLSGSIQTSSGPLAIGARAAGNGNWYRGRIDELKIWNYALNAAEVAAAATL